MEVVGRAVVGGAAGTGGPVRDLAVRVRVDLEDETAASGVAMVAVAAVMGQAVVVAVAGTSQEPVDRPSGSSPS
jgi:hypothetical protein